MSRKRFALLLLFTAALLLISFWSYSRSKVYDNGNAEVIYTSQGVDYQLCIAWADTPFTPAHQRSNSGVMNRSYRYPALYQSCGQ